MKPINCAKALEQNGHLASAMPADSHCMRLVPPAPRSLAADAASSCSCPDTAHLNAPCGPLKLGDSFVKGEWDCPELDRFMTRVFTAQKSEPASRYLKEVLFYLVDEALFKPQGRRRAVQVARRHYDLGNDLFRLMLDPSMSYTCADWDGADSLESAQTNKLHRWCERLKLSPGMRVLDIGCGWGNFAQYAATHYGVEVTGITNSVEQAKLASRRCAGLPVEIKVCDYREIIGQFDRIISIEMIEAVGRKYLGTFFSSVRQCLSAGGLFGLQAISSNVLCRSSKQSVNEFFLWVRKNIFPNGYLPSIQELVAPTCSDFVIEQMQQLGSHYDRTLMEWHRNFRANMDRLDLYRYPADFRRKWNFYLLGCAALFRSQRCQVYQIVYRSV